MFYLHHQEASLLGHSHHYTNHCNTTSALLDSIDQNQEDQGNADLVPSPDTSSRYPSYEIIPSPRTLQEYEEILSGSMDRNLSMAEAQTQHRREIEKRDQEHRMQMEEEQTEMKKLITDLH